MRPASATSEAIEAEVLPKVWDVLHPKVFGEGVRRAPEASQVVAEGDGLRVTLILQKYLYLHFRIRTSSKSSKSSVARSGGIPPKWLILASPWRENFGLAESAKSLNGGFFWTFLIFISKITKY